MHRTPPALKEAVGEEKAYRAERPVRCTHVHTATCAYVSKRQHTSAYVSTRQHTSAYVHAATCAACAAACRHVECELPFPLPQREPGLHLRFFFTKNNQNCPRENPDFFTCFAFHGAALIKTVVCLHLLIFIFNYFFI